MARTFTVRALVPAMLILLLSACEGGGGNPPPNPQNQPPVAVVEGPVKGSVHAGSNVLLDASQASDADGSIGSVRWEQKAGPAVTIADPAAELLEFIAPLVTEDTEIVFTLTVTDDDGATATTEFRLLIHATVPENTNPSAATLADLAVQAGSDVQLDARGSVDADGSIVTYAWTQLDGDGVLLGDAASAVAAFTAPGSTGLLRFRLLVTDDDGATDSDMVNVQVLAANANQPPQAVVTALTNPVVEGTGFTLDGGTSSDETALEYFWTVPAGFAVQGDGARESRLQITDTPDVSTDTSYTFLLVVSDGQFTAATSAEVTVAAFNRPPAAGIETAPAGVVQGGLPEGGSVTLTAAATDPDGHAITRFSWEQRDGDETVDLSGATGDTLVFDAPDVGPEGDRYEFRVTAADIEGASASATIAFNVNFVNRAPGARLAASASEAAEGTTVRLTAAGSEDPDGQPLTFHWEQVDLLNGMPAATIVDNGDGTADAVMPDIAVEQDGKPLRFRVVADDGSDAQNTASAGADVKVRFVNRAPQLNRIVASRSTVAEGNLIPPVTLSVDAFDPDGNPLSYNWTLPVGFAGTGRDTPVLTLTRTPDVGAGATLTFNVEVRDPEGGTATFSIPLSVQFANSPPVADAGPVVEIPENADLVVQEFRLDGTGSRDSDEEKGHQSLTFNWRAPTDSGLVLDNPAAASPRIVALPDVSSNVEINVTLEVSDGVATATAMTTVQVRRVNQPPVVEGISGISEVEEGGTFELTANATDDGEIARYEWVVPAGFAIDPASREAATLRVTGTPDVTATDAANGITRTFSVIAIDNADECSASVAHDVTVAFRNQRPVVSGVSGSTTVNEQTAGHTLTANGTDGDGHALQYRWTRSAADASGISDDALGIALPFEERSIVFDAPDVDIDKTVVFTVAASDGIDDSDPFDVAITILKDGGAPVIESITPSAVAIPEGAGHAFTLTAVASDNLDAANDLVYDWTSAAGFTTRVDADQPHILIIESTPDVGVGGEDFAFSVSATDSDAHSVESTTSIHVDFVNVSPVIEGVEIPSNADEGDEVTMRVNARDDDGQTLAYQWVRTGGAAVDDLVTRADGSATFTAPEVGPGDVVSISFAVTVNDQSGAENASVESDEATVTIDFVNAAPVIDDSALDRAVEENTPVTLTVPVTEPDGQAVTFIWQQDSADTEQVDLTDVDASGNPTFTAPVAAAPLDLHFSVTARDGEGEGALTDVANLTVTVNPVNDLPVIGEITLPDSIDEDSDQDTVEATITVSVTDETPAGELGYTWTVPDSFVVTGADTNTLRIVATPNVTANTPYTFLVRVDDGDGGIAESPDLGVTVNFVNQPPQISAVAGESPVNEGDAGVELSVMATDDDEHPLTYRWTQREGELPDVGEITVDTDTGTGTFTAPDVEDVDVIELHFTVEVDDANGGVTASGEVAVNVLRVNENPGNVRISPASATVNEGAIAGEGLTLTVTAEDDATPVDELEYQWSGLDGFTFAGEATNTLTITATPDVTPATQPYELGVTVSDGAGGETTAFVTLTVEFVNQPPTVDITSNPANLASDGINESGGTIVLTANGADPDGVAPAAYSWAQTGASGISLGIADAEGSEVSFAVPSVDANTTFTVEVTAEDIDAPDVTATRAISFTVLDTGDTAAVRLSPVPADLVATGVRSGFSVNLQTTTENMIAPVTYLWSQTEGSATADIEIDGRTDSEVGFVAPEVDTDTTVTVQVVATAGDDEASAQISFTIRPRPDDMPLPFTFTDLTRVPAHDLPGTPKFASEAITLSGLSAPAAISISAGGEYAVNGSTTFRTTPTTVNNNDTVVVRVSGSTTVGVERAATLTVGGISDTFSVTTVDPNFAVDTGFGSTTARWDSLQGLDNTQLYYSTPSLTSDTPTFGFLQAFTDATEFSHVVPEYIWAINWATGGYRLRGDNLHSSVTQLKNGFFQFSPAASRDVIGYFKSPLAESAGEHGDSVALWTFNQLSPLVDRSVMVVGAPGESDASAAREGRVHIYHRDGNNWLLAQTLHGSSTGDRFGEKVVLSGDGNVLAVSAPGKDLFRDAASDYVDAGEVYIYRRDEATGLFVDAGEFLRSASIEKGGEQFGTSIALSASGDVLTVGVPFDQSGVAGNPDDETAADAGAVYMFRHTGTGWNQEAYIKETTPVAGNLFGTAVAFGLDDRLFASRLGVTRSVFVYEPAAGAWNPVAQLDQPAGTAASFGEQLSATRTRTPGFDADVPTFVTGTHVYERTATGAWNATDLISVVPAAARAGTPASIAITEGSTPTVVTIAFEGTVKAGSGIYLPTNIPAATAESGSVYVFTKFFAWQFKRLLKAPNSDDNDRFGECTAIDFQARHIAVCAPGEDSAGTGVHPVEPIDMRGDNTVEDAGAVYIY